MRYSLITIYFIIKYLYFKDGVVSLYGLPDLSPVTPLSQAKNALSFMIHTTVLHVLKDGKLIYNPPKVSSESIPSVVTRLVVGCRKKVVIYTWRDGEVQETKVTF